MSCHKPNFACSLVTFLLGLLLLLGAICFVGLRVADKLIDTELSENLYLSPDSFVFSQWKNPSPPIYMQYWFFNVTNSEDVVNGEKPIVTEHGPFTFRFYQPKTNIAFYPNDTVSYKFNHTLVFLPEKSVGSLNMSITQLNVPLLTIQSFLKVSKIPHFLVNLLINLLQDSSVFVDHTVEEWLFGYEDPIFKLLHKFAPDFHIDIPSKFGFFAGYNNSDDGLYLVKTGKNNVNQANQISKWNGNDMVSWWTTNQSNMINGTDGTFMSPKVDTSKKLYGFVTDVCRSLYFVFANHTSVKEIDTLRFHVPAEVFANATENPNNRGFCVPTNSCLDSGVLDISSCKQGAPIIVSSPHFYMGAQKYIEGVVGMHPNKKEHETFVDVEPMSGFVFSGAKRLQINVYLQNLDIFYSLKEVHKVILPVLWLNESVLVDQSTANIFKSKVINLIEIVHLLQYVILAIGAILFLVGCGLLLQWNKTRRSKSMNLLLNNDDDDNFGDDD